MKEANTKALEAGEVRFGVTTYGVQPLIKTERTGKRIFYLICPFLEGGHSFVDHKG
jgi:hypothetical protein